MNYFNVFVIHGSRCKHSSIFICSVEVVLRAEAVETAQAGDKCDFTGTLIVVPDVSAISMPGNRSEQSSKPRGQEEMEGVKGLKVLGVRDLSYRMAYLACTVASCNRKVRNPL